MIKKLFILTLVSVASMFGPCKLVWAEDTPKFIDGFKLGGYTSTSITAPLEGRTELRMDDLSFMLSWDNDGSFKFFSELELERPIALHEDKRFNSKNMYFDLERLYLDYNLSEKINFRAGRFLTSTGRWNLLHAAPLEWTTTRPLATSQLFPKAVNGFMLYGTVPNDSQSFDYSIFVEGTKEQINDNEETKFKNVAGARLLLSNKFNLGLSLVTFTDYTAKAIDYRLVGVDFFTYIKDWEISGEGFQRFASGGKDGGSGVYLQSAVPFANQWHWLTRIESYHRPNLTSGERWVMGVTKKVTSTQLLKMEYVGGSDGLPDEPRGIIASYAVLF